MPAGKAAWQRRQDEGNLFDRFIKVRYNYHKIMGREYISGESYGWNHMLYALSAGGKGA